MLRDLLLVLMLGLRAPMHEHEAPEARRARLDVVAQAIQDASQRASCADRYAQPGCQRHWPGTTLDLALLLITEAYAESRLALNIHAGECRSFECDPYRSLRTGLIEHRARTLWQMHNTLPVAGEWNGMVGTDLDSTKRAAWAAAKLLSRGYQACRTIGGAVSRFAGLASCNWSGASGRVELFEQLKARAHAIQSGGRKQSERRAERTRPAGPRSR